MAKKLALFGSTGFIGSAIARKFADMDWEVIPVLHRASSAGGIFWDINAEIPGSLVSVGPFDSICWAQGVNLNDSIYNFNLESHQNVYSANVEYILITLSELIKAGSLKQAARLCVISSIWQNISRQDKLSYAVSKAALQGLVLSLANDMAKDGHLVNAVLPGALDTPMTRKNLTASQIEFIESSTAFKHLPQVQDVVNAAYFLASDENTGVTGQFIKVDLGFSDVRNF
jgi:3-oxoacyl-[acyl-carrier protein] reductase